MWPEPPKRVVPPVRAALVLPDSVACPDGCKRFSSPENLSPLIANKLRCGAVVGDGSLHLTYINLY